MRGDRRLSYVPANDGTFRDFTQGATDQTKNPLDVAIDGSGFLVVQTAGGERYTRDGGLQMNGQGQLVTSGGDPVLGTAGPIVFQPTDHDISIAADGTVTVQEGTSHHQLAARPAPIGELSRRAENAEGRLQPLCRRRRRNGTARHSNPRSARATSRSPMSASVAEMSRMIEVTRAYTQIATMLQQESDLHKSAIREAFRSSVLTFHSGDLTCRLFRPLRPEWRPRNLVSRSSPTTSRTCRPPATRSRPPRSRI